MLRRNFVRTCTSTALVATVPASVRQLVRPRAKKVLQFPDPTDLTTLRDPRVRALALHAVDAARAAGASYADVRLENIITREGKQIDTLDLSVRSLVNGYWGWASTPTLSTDEAVRVARLSASFATAAAKHGPPRTVELGTIPVVANGTWETPMTVDPFSLQMNEIVDWIAGITGYITDHHPGLSVPEAAGYDEDNHANYGILVRFQRTEKLFASTEGSVIEQTVTKIWPSFGVMTSSHGAGESRGSGLGVQGGWEQLPQSDADIEQKLHEAVADAERRYAIRSLPLKAPVIGRYDMIFSAAVIGNVLGVTLARATQLDRALGYDATASGTSYLGPDPMAFLGTPVASPLVTLTGERSTPTALCTIGWDDEGVAPEDFALIEKGVLVDYQTTREQAAWLAPWYAKQGRPVKSHGCADAPTGGDVAMQHAPNLVLHPGTADLSLDDLIAGMDHGLVIDDIYDLQTDWQSLDGMGTAYVAREVRRGRPVARIKLPDFVFRSTEFWNNVTAIGGPRSVDWCAPGYPALSRADSKGKPNQGMFYSAATVPVRVKDVAVVNLRSK